MHPFEVRWPASEVDSLRQRVAAFRLPASPPGAGWRYGCDPGFLQTLCAYWADGFDAQAAAAKLNRLPQFLHRVEDIDLHAVHVVGEAQGRRPLLLLHGWPGSILEFWDVAEALAFPSRHGGRTEDAFDLVIPSLPGYGFSGKSEAPVSVRTMARLVDKLMREGFGYQRYLVQGGDVGAGVSAWLGLDHPDSLQAIHLNFMLVHPDAQPQTDEERTWQSAYDGVQRRLGAYLQLQATKPTSLAYAMVDNPVAQAAWLVERFHDWSDLRDKPFEQVFSKDTLLTEAMIYIMNDAFISSSWSYAAMADEGVRVMPKGRRVDVPTAFAAFPDPRTVTPPRSWVERGYALSRWTNQPRGGHFAAMEAPDLFVADIRAWGRDA